LNAEQGRRYERPANQKGTAQQPSCQIAHHALLASKPDEGSQKGECQQRAPPENLFAIQRRQQRRIEIQQREQHRADDGKQNTFGHHDSV
jgi:hypothetical protein